MSYRPQCEKYVEGFNLPMMRTTRLCGRSAVAFVRFFGGWQPRCDRHVTEFGQVVRISSTYQPEGAES